MGIFYASDIRQTAKLKARIPSPMIDRMSVGVKSPVTGTGSAVGEAIGDGVSEGVGVGSGVERVDGVGVGVEPELLAVNAGSSLA